MRGIVREINATRGMVAVETDRNDFTVVEVLDSVDIEVGDELQGNLQALGAKTLLNLTKGKPVDAVVQNFHVTVASLRDQMLR